jgi:nicotinamidase-related amidase
VPAAHSSYTAPELERAALITIDVQADVLDGQPLEIPGSSAALVAIASLARAFRARGLPIAHIVRLYRRDGSNVDLCRREAVENGWPALAPGSPGSELAPGLALASDTELDHELLLRGEPQPIGASEVVIYKPRWGAFFQTPLHEHLRALGVSTLVFAGFNFPNCPRTSIYEASERDFRLVAVSDAISGLYERGQRELTSIGASFVSSEKLIGALELSAQQSASASV